MSTPHRHAPAAPPFALPDLDGLELARLRRRRSEKWGTYAPDVLPAWVAEMDYPLAEPIRRVLEDALAYDDLGYPVNPRPQDLPTVFAARMAERFGWRIDPQRVDVLTDVVQGIYVAIDRFSAPGEGVVVQTPVYPPFLHAVRDLGRRMVENPLVRGAGRDELDLDGLRAALDPATRILLLCNPQNPTGRVFERRELEALAEIALRHDLVVVSDEIHADLGHQGLQHPVAALRGGALRERRAAAPLPLAAAPRARRPGPARARRHRGGLERVPALARPRAALPRRQPRAARGAGAPRAA